MRIKVHGNNANNGAHEAQDQEEPSDDLFLLHQADDAEYEEKQSQDKECEYHNRRL